MADTDSAAGNGGTPAITAETPLARLRAALRALNRVPALAGRDGEAGRRARPPGATPQTTEGPYYAEGSPVRRNIATGCPGVPLDLRITVLDALGRRPVGGALADVWHCDAGGWYSGHLDIPPDTVASTTGTVPPAGPERFLRGMQPTDGCGVAEFRTIYPGWYCDRAVHIHLKVHVGGHEVFTGQLYFPEKYNQIVAALPPYREHTALERVPNADDVLYQRAGGPQTTLEMWPNYLGRPELGFTASFTVVIVPIGHGDRHERGNTMTRLSPADQLEIHQLLAWYGHVVDRSQWDRLSEIYTSDAIFDVRVPGSAVTHRGIDEIRAAYASAAPFGNPQPGPYHRPGHHSSNIVIRDDDGRVRALSYYFGSRPNGEMFNGEYEDELVRTPWGWRIRSRIVLPLHDAGLDP